MRVDVFFHVHVCDPKAQAMLEQVLTKLNTLTVGVTTMSAELDRLTTEVTENTSVIQSAVTLLGNLSQIIRDNASDPAALNALADQLDSSGNQLAEAVAANTPAA